MSLKRNAGVMGLAVMISRVLGLVREQVFAFFFGAGMASDAYLVAFRIPNLFRDLFAEGALSAAFVTVFSRTPEGEESKRLAENVFTVMSLIVGLVCVLLFVFAPEFVTLLADDFLMQPEKFQLTVGLTRLFAPFLYFASSAALAMGILNSRGVFFVPSLGAAAFNLGNVVVGGILAYLLRSHGVVGSIWGFAIGTLLGGFLQWGTQWPALRGHGFIPWAGLFNLFSWSKIKNAFGNPKLHEIAKLMAPAVLSVAAVQINVMINTSFATSLEAGSVSWLSYAYRIMHFPMGVFGVALSTATLPRLSKLIRDNDRLSFQTTLEEALKWTMVLAVGSTMGLIVFREVLVSLIYQHGQVFQHVDTIKTGTALAAYALGLLAFNASKIFVAAFYALDSIKLPSLLSFSSIALNYILNSYFSQKLGHAGLALSTALTATLNMLLLLTFLWVQGHYRPSLALLRAFFSTCLGASGIYLWAYFDVPRKLYDIRVNRGFTPFALETLAHVAAAGILYLLIVAALDPSGRKLVYHLQSRFRRKPKS